MRLGSRFGRAIVATAVTGGVIGSGVADAAAPSPVFYPSNVYDVGSQPEAVAIGDLTGDGRLDVLMSTSYSFNPAADFHLWLFAQQPDGSLGAPTSIATGGVRDDSMGLELADLDGDGDLDVAVATSAGVEIYAQDAGALAYSSTVPAPGAGQVEAGDFTGDGLIDLAVSSDDGVRALRQVPFPFSVILGEFAELAWVTTQAQREIEVADLTGDGVPDVVGLAGSTISVFRKSTGDSFGAGETRPTGGVAPWSWGNGIAAGDLTGDGLLDVGVTIGGNSPNARVSVLAQQADGTLAAPVVYGSNDVPGITEAADVNADGLTDLVVVHGGWQTTGVYLQQDDGTLSDENLYGIPNSNHYNVDGLAIGDVTGDGRADLALADRNRGLVLRRSVPPGVDITPPDTTITSGPSGTHTSRAATFTFTADEAAATFECRLGTEAYSPCSSPATYSELTAGTYTFEVRAIDDAGNVDPSPAVRSFRVEGPDTTITEGPSGTLRSTEAAFSFTGSPNPAGFECSLGTAAFAACTSPTTYTGLETGSSHTFRVRAVSSEGLADGTPAQWDWSTEKAADVATALTDSPDPVKRNGTLTYIVSVTNLGPTTAWVVKATLNLPAGFTLESVEGPGSCPPTGSPSIIRCGVDPLAVGQTVTITVKGRVTAGNNTVLTSTAYTSTTSWDHNSSNDTVSTSTRVGAK